MPIDRGFHVCRKTRIRRVFRSVPLPMLHQRQDVNLRQQWQWLLYLTHMKGGNSMRRQLVLLFYRWLIDMLEGEYNLVFDKMLLKPMTSWEGSCRTSPNESITHQQVCQSDYRVNVKGCVYNVALHCSNDTIFILSASPLLISLFSPLSRWPSCFKKHNKKDKSNFKLPGHNVVASLI